jgi:hypothetical protein
MTRLLRTYRELWLTALLATLGVASIFFLGRDGWRGWQPNGGIVAGQLFCEPVGDGAVRTPFNSWSNAGFLVVALLVAYRIGRDRREAARSPNLMIGTGAVPVLYASLLVFLGVGSMYLHASCTRLGGKIDVASMFTYATFLAAHRLARGRSAGVFFVIYVLLTVPLLALHGFGHLPTNETFGVLVTVFFLGELLPAGSARPDRRWLAAASASFLAAFVIWLPSRPGGALCGCAVPGHAVWHLLCAAATWFLYRYFRSESRRAPPPVL